MFGFLNINKPEAITSHDVVNRVRKLLHVKQVGHAGTLDPLATGVLVIALGQACRLLRFLPDDKTYLAQILFGQTTTTDDVEGEVIERQDKVVRLTAAEMKEMLLRYVGTIDQIPPLYSAVHHEGERLYKLARSGAPPVEIKSRAVVIHSLDLLEYNYPLLTLRIHCGKGTYIRSLARDLGKDLGVGGCLKSLKREQSGPFAINAAIDLNDVTSADELVSKIIPPQKALIANPHLHLLPLAQSEAHSLRMGQQILLSEKLSAQNEEQLSSKLVLTTCDDRIVALCKLNEEMRLKAEVVISHGE